MDARRGWVGLYGSDDGSDADGVAIEREDDGGSPRSRASESCRPLHGRRRGGELAVDRPVAADRARLMRAVGELDAERDRPIAVRGAEREHPRGRVGDALDRGPLGICCG